MKLIAKMAFGSTIYGTRTPKSDMDYKFIFVPSPKDIILQSVKNNVKQNTKLSESNKNTSEDTDCEGFSIQEYLKHLVNGQTMAIDMLFTPREFIEPGELYRVWEVVQKNKHRLITNKVKAFVGYCRGQAVRYSVKGDRLNAAEYAVNALQAAFVSNPDGKLEDTIYTHFLDNPYPDFIKIVVSFEDKSGNDRYLEVNGRKFQLNKTIYESLKQAQLILNEYGHRARNAAENNGVDAKALYHAVRVASEAEELLLTGKVTFPRPEKDLLMKIRNNEITYYEISDLLDEKLIAVENAMTVSRLPSEHDEKFVEDLIYNTYLNEIKKL